MSRGQLPLSVLEVAIGLVFLFAVILGFALGVPAADTRTPQLEAYAEDAATILVNEPPRHGGTTRLGEVVASNDSFERERDALEARTDRILPENLLYRITTPHGSVGYPEPRGVARGEATVTTGAGTVSIRVWYA